ncbi:MAG: serine/threonine protein kinase [Chloroflexi bacterium]|nr:MAG: serine/threonine protein kinase [Chloroflexota bacterium]
MADLVGRPGPPELRADGPGPRAAAGLGRRADGEPPRGRGLHPALHRRGEAPPGGGAPADGQVGVALPDLSGTTVGRYRVVRRIGAGAASAVYRAVDLADERQVALKFLDPELASRPGFLARCVEEIATVSRLEHPAIVPVHEVATRGPLTYVSMRLVRGGTLRDVLGRRPVDVRSALGIVREVASALHSAHESGVVHQDLKPSNVLVETDGSVLVADFGLAPARYGYPTSAPWYRSPEQVSGAEPDRRTDVHALGQLLYELVTGTRPPAEGHAGGAALPGQVDRVLFQALDPDPARRPATVVQFLGELGDVPAAGVRGAWARDQLPALIEASRWWAARSWPRSSRPATASCSRACWRRWRPGRRWAPGATATRCASRRCTGAAARWRWRCRSRRWRTPPARRASWRSAARCRGRTSGPRHRRPHPPPPRASRATGWTPAAPSSPSRAPS